MSTAQVTWQRRLMYGGSLVCQVESVRVLPALRGRGLGGELMRWIVWPSAGGGQSVDAESWLARSSVLMGAPVL